MNDFRLEYFASLIFIGRSKRVQYIDLLLELIDTDIFEKIYKLKNNQGVTKATMTITFEGIDKIKQALVVCYNQIRLTINYAEFDEDIKKPDK